MIRRTFWLVSLILAVLLAGCAPGLIVEDTFTPPTETVENIATETPTVVWFPPTATITPFASPTFQPTQNMRPGIGNVILEDPMVESAFWPIVEKQSGRTAFGNGELSLAISQPGSSICIIRTEPVLSNYYLEVNSYASLCENMDAYGIIFHSAGEQFYYRLLVSCSGTSRLEQVKSGQYEVIHNWTISGQIPVGAPASLKLGIWVYHDQMRFFANDVYQFGVENLQWQEGQIGFYARSNANQAMSVSFSSLTVSRLGTEAAAIEDPQLLPTFSIPTKLPFGNCCGQ